MDHTRIDERRLKAGEMPSLRCVSSYTLWFKETSGETRSHLAIRTFDKQIHERKKNKPEHMQRIPSEGTSKQIIYYQPLGRCDRGRPRRRWLNDLMFEDETG
jgi:hypothetical protein